MRPRRGRRVTRGLTLLELMLSVALGVVVLLAATYMLLSASRMRRNQQLLSDANQEARTALKAVARTLASAGAGASTFTLRDSANKVQTQVSVISFRDGATPDKNFGPLKLRKVDGTPVLDASVLSRLKQQPDELVVLRYGADRRSDLVGNLTGSTLLMTPDPRVSTTPGVVPEVFMSEESALITNFTKAVLIPVKGAKVAPSKNLEVDISPENKPEDLQDAFVAVQPGSSVFPVRVIRYRLAYVPPQGNLPERTDLLMETLDPAVMLQDSPPAKRSVVLARDVEDFQVKWGYDNNGDGIADPDPSQIPTPDKDVVYGDVGPDRQGLSTALAFARISLSVRTSSTLMDENGQVVPNDKQVSTPLELGLDTRFGGTPLSPTATNGYRRRILSTVVVLKNVAAKRI